MSKPTDIPLPLSPDVVIRPLDDDGRCVVKNTRKRSYVKLGGQEAFLLSQLDGQKTYADITAAFEQRYGEPVACEDVQDFVAMLKEERLVGKPNGKSSASDRADEDLQLGFFKRTIKAARRKNPLYFRVTLIDPDRLLNWLEPKTRWLFSRNLAIVAAVGAVLAMAVTWSNRHHLVSQFAEHFNWKTAVIAWFTTLLVTTIHEFGHGLACKRYGGEVHEMGLLYMFFTPCFFCNVSDAWLLKSRWQRLLISMAGTYVDLLIWIVAVFVWRVTLQDTSINYMAWIICTTCGVRVLFNINPLLRLDGYYALADLVGIANLRRRSRALWLDHVRWIMWGAPRPVLPSDGRLLLLYGVVSWFFKVGFLIVMGIHITAWLQSCIGFFGIVAGVGGFFALAQRYFKGSLGEDFKIMLRTRKKRLLVFGALLLVVGLFPIRDRATGSFQVRPVVRWEVRAPIAGFLRDVRVDEGDHVQPSVAFARIEVPELESEIVGKNAEIDEAEANLRRLEAGPRPEEVAEQRERIKRAIAWRDLAASDLEHARRGLNEELARLDLRIAQAKAEFEYRDTLFQQATQLYEKGGLAGRQLLAEKKQWQAAESELHQVEAEKRAREAEGVIRYEGELAHREKDLADTRATLALLEAGSRSEDIEAERAKLLRLREELNHLLEQREKQAIICPVAGTITTPRLREKVGQYLDRGAVICVVEDLTNLEAEISVEEQYARTLVRGQEVLLKPRALPFTNLTARVDRIAPATASAQSTSQSEPHKSSSSQSTVTVYCVVDNEHSQLCTGMTGFGRIYQSLRPLGWIVMNRVLRFFRTEFWW